MEDKTLFNMRRQGWMISERYFDNSGKFRDFAVASLRDYFELQPTTIAYVIFTYLLSNTGKVSFSSGRSKHSFTILRRKERFVSKETSKHFYQTRKHIHVEQILLSLEEDSRNAKYPEQSKASPKVNLLKISNQYCDSSWTPGQNSNFNRQQIATVSH